MATPSSSSSRTSRFLKGFYTLTTLLRGRRGTEVFTGGHAAGDLFVLLDGVTRRPFGLDRLGDTVHYRAVGRGGELRDARTEQLTLAGNDLKPYAPVHLAATGTWGSNVTLNWVRRSRVGGELIDGSGEVPLAEDSEEYELEILGPEGGCHARRSLDHLSRQEDLTMAWGSDAAATQLTSITTEQFFD
jgi:hypothetical protein